jgi:hypothetical protein
MCCIINHNIILLSASSEWEARYAFQGFIEVRYCVLYVDGVVLCASMLAAKNMKQPLEVKLSDDDLLMRQEAQTIKEPERLMSHIHFATVPYQIVTCATAEGFLCTCVKPAGQAEISTTEPWQTWLLLSLHVPCPLCR